MDKRKTMKHLPPLVKMVEISIICVGGGDVAPFFTKPAFIHPYLCEISRRTRIWHPFCPIQGCQTDFQKMQNFPSKISKTEGKFWGKWRGILKKAANFTAQKQHFMSCSGQVFSLNCDI